MSGDWVPWSAKVPQVEVETHKVSTVREIRRDCLVWGKGYLVSTRVLSI